MAHAIRKTLVSQGCGRRIKIQAHKGQKQNDYDCDLAYRFRNTDYRIHFDQPLSAMATVQTANQFEDSSYRFEVLSACVEAAVKLELSEHAIEALKTIIQAANQIEDSLYRYRTLSVCSKAARKRGIELKLLGL